jgi:hypothetical protein
MNLNSFRNKLIISVKEFHRVLTFKTSSRLWPSSALIFFLQNPIFNGRRPNIFHHHLNHSNLTDSSKSPSSDVVSKSLTFSKSSFSSVSSISASFSTVIFIFLEQRVTNSKLYSAIKVKLVQSWAFFTKFHHDKCSVTCRSNDIFLKINTKRCQMIRNSFV